MLDHSFWTVRLIEGGVVVWESRFEGRTEAEAFAAWLLDQPGDGRRVEVVPPE